MRAHAHTLTCSVLFSVVTLLAGWQEGYQPYKQLLLFTITQGFLPKQAQKETKDTSKPRFSGK